MGKRLKPLFLLCILKVRANKKTRKSHISGEKNLSKIASEICGLFYLIFPLLASLLEQFRSVFGLLWPLGGVWDWIGKILALRLIKNRFGGAIWSSWGSFGSPMGPFWHQIARFGIDLEWILEGFWVTIRKSHNVSFQVKVHNQFNY